MFLETSHTTQPKGAGPVLPIFGDLLMLLIGSREDFRVVRIDPLRFLAGCRTRRLNQV